MPTVSSDEDALFGLIRESAEAYITHEGTLVRARHARSGAGLIDPAAWRQMADLGWSGMLVSEESGGGGMDLGAGVVLHEVLGRGIMPEPLALAAHLPALLLRNASSSSAREILAGIAAGDAPVAVAWQGRAGALSVEDTGVLARSHHGKAVLSGEASFVAAMGDARWILVAARSEVGIGVSRVSRDALGLQVLQERFTDGSLAARLVFNDVAIDDADLLISPGEGGLAVDAALDGVRLILCAELLGVMRAAFAMTLDYLKTRKQFGRTIGSFQALQHRAVDLHAQIEMTSAALALGTRQFTEATDARGRALAASSAKARAADAGLLITREAVQMHGAIGYTDEHDVGLYLARAMTLATQLGNGAAHRRRYGQLLAQTITA